MMDLYPLFRPLLFAADPEAAHSTTFAALDAAARLGLARAFTPRLPADPVTVMGIAFPNRVGLAAGLDKKAALSALLRTLMRERAALADAHGRRVPLVVKLAPDLDEDALRGAAKVLLAAGVDGVIATNTTLARDGVAGMPQADEAGGLSGR